MAELKASQRLKKQLGLLDVYAIATGSTLSAGFFLLPGLAAVQAGPAIILAYALAIIPLLPALACKAELGTAMPRAGGVYFYLDRTMGPAIGTIGGFGTWLVLVLKVSFALVGLGAYLHLFLPNVPLTPIVVGIALLLGVLNLLGSKSAGGFQVFLVVGLLSILAAFIVAGATRIETAPFENFFEEGIDSIFSTAGFVYISYIGITKVASLSEEVKDPEKNLPKGIFLAMITAVVVYVLGTTVMVMVVPMDQLKGDYTPVATTAQIILGDWGVYVVVVAALLAFTSVANAGILSASRYPLAMSRDHLIPRAFAKLGFRNNPTTSVTVTVALIIAFLITIDPIKIAKLASSFQLVMFAMVCFAVLVMRESGIESYDPAYKAPWYP
ncbi:MAG: amino acid permease, partial [Candidatus Eisenbacteria bacterium]|nr:amino acid permease [Candidatus Eisenbacteria bacterium]